MVEQGESGTEPVTRLDHQADLIRQEHRLYYILSNWWTCRNYDGDPRQHAARRALIWRVVVSLLAQLPHPCPGIRLFGLWGRRAWPLSGL